jgi:hypothetical protein
MRKVPEIRSTIRFENVDINGVFTSKSCEFIDFEWEIDDGREYFVLNKDTNTITSLGIYDNYDEGPVDVYDNERLLVKFF